MANVKQFMSDEQLKIFREYVALQTVSSIKENPEMKKAAQWLKALFASSGFTTARVLKPTGHYPCVVGTLDVDPALPTLLLYGHYDVQPVGELSKWKTDPFILTVNGEKIFGRGACDNKGQNMAALFAVMELVAEKAKLSYNIKFLLDGNEEIGSLGLDEILERHKDELEADAVIGIDGVTPDPKRAVIYYTSKGLAYYSLKVYGPETELHSGYFGGKVHNPATLLAHFLSSVVGDEAELPEALKIGIQQPSESEVAELKKKTPANEYTKAARNRFQSVIDVHSLQAGHIDQLKTAIPVEASAQYSVRLAPFQDCTEFNKLMSDAAARFFKQYNVRFELELLATANPGYTDPTSRYVMLAKEALTKGFGAEPLVERMPATLPVFEFATRYLQKPFVLTSFGLPSSNTHAVNENLHLPQFLKAKQFIKSLLCTETGVKIPE